MTDQTYVRQVEAALSGKDAFSFIAQNPEDYEAFTSIVCGEGGVVVVCPREGEWLLCGPQEGGGAVVTALILLSYFAGP